VGLIARHLEDAGLPTLCMSAAYSITRSVNPPRSVFLDFPLGQTCGRPGDPQERRAIMQTALEQTSSLGPGDIFRLPFPFADSDEWKNTVMRPIQKPDGTLEMNDFRTARLDSPQYQSDADQGAADPKCPSCVFISAD
jgi:hypothetical protein